MNTIYKRRIANILIGIIVLAIDISLLAIKYHIFSIPIPAAAEDMIQESNPLLYVFLLAVALYAIFHKPRKHPRNKGLADPSRRKFLTFTATLAHDEGIQALNKRVISGVATVTGKRKAQSKTPVIPAGAEYYDKFKTQCNSCMACIQACPQHILEPGLKLGQGMLPKMVFQNGWCPTECTVCTEVCPTTALTPISKEEKRRIRIGNAVWIKENCIAADGKECRECEEICPEKCIEIVQNGRKSYPVINSENCLGCGACEYVCPSAPLKGIYVEGFAEHSVLKNSDIEEEILYNEYLH